LSYVPFIALAALLIEPHAVCRAVRRALLGWMCRWLMAQAGRHRSLCELGPSARREGWHFAESVGLSI
jgi:hypothetical protein